MKRNKPSKATLPENWKASDFSIDKLCRWYCIHSYLYYQLHHSVISDLVFDAICNKLLKKYKRISKYWKKYIKRSSLRAGTGFDLKFNEFPLIISQTAFILKSRTDYRGNEINLKKWLGKLND